MGDPLSVLGAAVGVTSLIIQLADECVKGYKIYSEAANLPQTHRYLLVRLHIEQQRFLNFALEAGFLNKDGVICSALQVNRSLLLAVLAEIKALFENFAAANGKYENVVAKSDVDWDDHSEPDDSLMSLLCLTASDNVQSQKAKPVSRRAEAAERIHGLGKSITETAKNLRTITLEPKRLVWAALDKDAFETFVSKIGSLNSFLVTLLDSSQLRRLRDLMNTTYLEILQLRNDVVDLTALTKALSPATQQQFSGADQMSNASSPAVVEEQAAILRKAIAEKVEALEERLRQELENSTPKTQDSVSQYNSADEIMSREISQQAIPVKTLAVPAHITTREMVSQGSLSPLATKERAIEEVSRETIATKTSTSSKSTSEDTVRHRLSDFFPENGQRQTAYTEPEIQRVSTLLSHINSQWSKVPRTYIVLRNIGCLDLLDTFVDQGFSDHWFPITERTLSSSLQPSKRSQFVAAQNLVMTKSMDLEKGQHCFFRKDEPLPLEMKETLGSGAYGQVNRAVSSISFQANALKRVLRSTVFGGKGTEFVKQFIAEIQVLKRIKHDHVVEFIGSYTDPKHMGLLVLPVADMDLSAYLDRLDMVKHRELRTFFGCLVRALEFLHEQRIRHKDIKPSNILVHGGKVLYTDFGLALDFTDKDGSTTTSMVNGRTAKYCAPEVADCESRNTSSDIWSLGVVFLEMTAVLKGRTVGYVYEFLEQHGTGQTFVRTNPTGTAALIADLKASGSFADNVALGWVQDMIMLNQKLRPTATSLIGSIIDEGRNGGGSESFCGICCVSHEDDLLSDLDELEIVDTD